MKRFILGITAHVDSGKTTLAEALLYSTGKIRTLGRVDHQTAFLDNHPMERERGITIFAHQASFQTGGAEFTLLDTPGHVDFSTETERTMQVLDYAILVISGTDGVQSHTETLWKLLRRYGVPTFLFVNKMDLPGADKGAILAQLQGRLGAGCADFSEPDTERFYESLALYEEHWMEEFLETGAIATEHLAQGILQGTLVPCYFGSALKNQGVDALLEGLCRFTVEKTYPDTFGAQVYKIATDEKNIRQTFLKVTGGALQVRDSVPYETQEGESVTEKVSQIRLYAGAKYQPVERVEAGQLCAVTGLSRTYAGQGLGEKSDGAVPVLEPVMRYTLHLPEGVHPSDALQKLSQLEEEDPALQLDWDQRTKQIQVQLMGEVQLEILQKLIADRFQWDVTFDEGQITYKETLACPVEGVGHYEPLCHYAEVHLLLEPLPAGSGLQFATNCREDDLDKNWQRLILTHLAEKQQIGVLTGSPITDLKITLCAGKAHLKHTEGGDFRQATYRAVRNGLRRGESVLLEPWYDFVLELPLEAVGRAMTDLGQMEADFQPPETVGERGIITGSVPVVAIQGYQQTVTGYTHGLGRLVCTQKGYAPCKHPETVIAAIGYDCDGDVENTADSVFCSHGAGYVVKWDQVQEKMHLPSCLPEKKADEPISTGGSRAARYLGSLAEDKELLAIFERTYGKIDRDSRYAFETPKEVQEAPNPATPSGYQGEEYLLVDGYNIIFAWEELKKIAGESLDAARAELMHILCNYCGYRQCKLILVFDAYKVKGQHREVEQFCNITVVYTQESETADSYIEKTTHQLCREHKVRVATSDGMEQVIILGNGALRVSAEEFHEEVRQAQREIREFLGKRELGKNLVEVK